MSKKSGRAAKTVESTPAPASIPAAALPPSGSGLSTPTAIPAISIEQRSIELKFAEGSSFQSLPREEQKRMMDCLLVYHNELPRLLAEGEAGRFAVVNVHEVAHVWDTAGDAIQAATLLIGANRFTVYQIKPQDQERLASAEKVRDPQCPR